MRAGQSGPPGAWGETFMSLFSPDENVGCCVRCQVFVLRAAATGTFGSQRGRLLAIPRRGMMILVAIGANLPFGRRSPLETCRWAAGELDRLPGLRLRGLSRWYRTVPLPPSDQPDYINGVAHLAGEISPEELLAGLREIETRAGRVRGEPNAARTLDLDIIAMGRLVRDAPDPVVPHPRAHVRGFVLWPLRDVAPDWRHPRLGVGVGELIARLGASDQ